MYGHERFNLDRAQLRPWIKAAAKLLPADVLAEFDGLLHTLPRARAQGSVNGLTPREKAQAILWHISTQRGAQASRLILASAYAVLSFAPMPTSSPMFRRVQVGRSIYRLLRADYLQLYGTRHRVKIAMQSHRTACELFKLVEPVLYFWLKDSGREQMRQAVAKATAQAVQSHPHQKMLCR